MKCSIKIHDKRTTKHKLTNIFEFLIMTNRILWVNIKYDRKTVTRG